MPIALFHFHKAGLYGALANVVAIPLTTFIIMPLEALALLFDLVGLGAPFWWLTGQALAFLLWLAHAAADAPGAVALLPAMPPAAFALIVAGGLWICLWRTRWRRWGLVPVALGALWALADAGARPPRHRRRPPPRPAHRRRRGSPCCARAPATMSATRWPKLSGAEPDYLELERLPDRRLQPRSLRRRHRPRRPPLAHPRHPHAAFRRAGTEMVRACAEADIVVADRPLPRGCTPRWLARRPRSSCAAPAGSPSRSAASPGSRPSPSASGRHPWAGAAR